MRSLKRESFYADDLPAKDLKVFKAYMETAVSDVRSFPPRFPLYSRTQFMKKVFWPALKRNGAMVVGFNLGLRSHANRAGLEGGQQRRMVACVDEYADGNENCNYPRILITPIDSKKQIIKLWRPWKKNFSTNGRMRVGRIHFLDLRTTALGALQQVSLAQDLPVTTREVLSKSKTCHRRMSMIPLAKSYLRKSSTAVRMSAARSHY